MPLGPLGGTDRERGVALLSALFAVALLTVIVIEMTDATLVHTNLNRNAGNAMAAQLLARSASIAAESILTDETLNDPDVTCKGNRPWELFGIPVGGGTVHVEIADERGKLDLNSVGNQAQRQVVQRLFSELKLDPGLVDRVAAWIEKPQADGSMATGGGSDYCALSMPCEPRQEPLRSLEELLLIRGFDEDTIRLLRPYVTVIPRAKSGSQAPKVNALTADPLVLTAIGCEASGKLPDCPSIGAGKEKMEEFKKEFAEWRTSACKDAASAGMVSAESNTFSIRTVGMVGDVNQTLRTLIQRSGKRASRLWWQERPVLEPVPVEVR